MSDESSTGKTVDRMQVVFSTNLEEMLSSLDAIEQKLQETSTVFASAEIASQKFAANMQGMTDASGISAVSDQVSLSMESMSASADAASECMSVYAPTLSSTDSVLTATADASGKAATEFNKISTATTSALVCIFIPVKSCKNWRY